MPSVTRAVEINLPEAVLLADLYEIAFDLGAAERLCDKVIELGKQLSRDYFVEEGLVVAAVVKYGRCFTDGVRLSLKLDDLATLDADNAAAHDYFIALRHKFIAHAVNAFEETYVTASARTKDGEMFPITSVHPGQHRMLLTAETAHALVQLISGVTAIVKVRIVAEEQKLLAFIQSLPIETIHSGDLHKPRSMAPNQVHDSRSRGVHSNKKPKR